MPEPPPGPADGPAIASDVRAILIVGPPRTGTTLLSSLLGGGSSVLSLSEPLLIHQLAKPARLRWFFTRFQRRARLRPVDPPLSSTPDEFLDFLCAIARRNGLQYLAIKETFHNGAMPPHWHNADGIRDLLPRFHAVEGIIRHPLDTVASTLKLFTPVLFGWQHRVLRKLFPRFPHFESPGEFVRWVAANCAHFVRWADENQLRIIRYEDLVTTPEACVRELCERACVPFEPRMLDLEQKRTAFGGLGDPSILMRPWRRPRPVHAGSIGRGKQVDESHRAIVREECAELASRFGYEL